MYYMYGFDPTYIWVIIGMVICLGASMRVKSTYARFSKVKNAQGHTGKTAAEAILRGAGISNVRVEHVSGELNDHYDPRCMVLRLSDSTFNSQSVAAIGVAAHECGHAIQHAAKYAPLRIRGALVPVANFGSMLAWPLILIGLFFNTGSSTLFINLGILAFSAAVLFQLITLPVEFDASNRAIRILGGTQMLNSQELGAAKKVLSAAALTYVASAAASILQLLRILLLSRGRRND